MLNRLGQIYTRCPLAFTRRSLARFSLRFLVKNTCDAGYGAGGPVGALPPLPTRTTRTRTARTRDHAVAARRARDGWIGRAAERRVRWAIGPGAYGLQRPTRARRRAQTASRQALCEPLRGPRARPAARAPYERCSHWSSGDYFRACGGRNRTSTHSCEVALTFIRERRRQQPSLTARRSDPQGETTVARMSRCYPMASKTPRCLTPEVSGSARRTTCARTRASDVNERGVIVRLSCAARAASRNATKLLHVNAPKPAGARPLTRTRRALNPATSATSAPRLHQRRHE